MAIDEESHQTLSARPTETAYWPDAGARDEGGDEELVKTVVEQRGHVRHLALGAVADLFLEDVPARPQQRAHLDAPNAYERERQRVGEQERPSPRCQRPEDVQLVRGVEGPDDGQPGDTLRNGDDAEGDEAARPVEERGQEDVADRCRQRRGVQPEGVAGDEQFVANDQRVGGQQQPARHRRRPEDEEAARKQDTVGILALVQEVDVPQANAEIGDAAGDEHGDEEERVRPEAVVAQAAGEDDPETEGEAVDRDLRQEDEIDVEEEATVAVLDFSLH